jgi:hypothetical protein
MFRRNGRCRESPVAISHFHTDFIFWALIFHDGIRYGPCS